ncbi:MAG TPA: MHYT domain-containing protein, partial [Coleofasciculaceae cyanobacterium]
MLIPVFGVYDWFLVCASLAIAIVASYTALDVAGRLRLLSSLQYRTFWLACGALVMGVGIWSMHFVGMLAFKLPMPVHYDLNTTALSLFWALAASGVALHVMSREVSRFSLAIGGLCMGLAIVAMHYTGMAAMRIPGEVGYNRWGVAASVLIAMGSAFGAVWLSLRLSQKPAQEAVFDVSWQSLSSAVVMGLGICGMHYTGMMAAQFVRLEMPPGLDTVGDRSLSMDAAALTLETPDKTAIVTSAGLAVDVALGAIAILAIALIMSMFERLLDRQRIREETLVDSEKRFRLLLDRLPTGVLLVDTEGRVLSCNPMAAKLLDTSIDDLQGQIFSAGLPLSNPNSWTLGQGVMPLQQVLDTDMATTRADNAPRSSDQRQWLLANAVLSINQGDNRRWLLANSDPILNEAGQVERVVCALTDITDRRLAELALQKTAKRESAIARVIQRMRQTLDLQTILDTTTRELQQIIECDRVLVYCFEPDWSGRVVSESVGFGWKPVYQNPDIEQIAVDRPECIIKAIDSQNLMIQDTYLQDTKGGAYKAVKSYRCVSDIYGCNFDACYLTLLEALQARAYIIVPIFCREQLWGLLASYQNDGPRAWAETEIASVVRIAEQFGVAVQQAELLAKTQQQTIELLTAKEEADRANKAKSNFLAHMSHELRTPLNAILGFTQLMARDPNLSPDHRKQTNIINRSGEHLLSLINSILDMSKIEAERVSLQVESFDLYRLLDTLYDMLFLKAESKGLVLEFDRDPSLPQFVATDQNRLRQILLNLLGNALKFTEQGRVVLKARSIAAPQPESIAPESKNSESKNFESKNSEFQNSESRNSALAHGMSLGPTADRRSLPPSPIAPVHCPTTLEFTVSDTGPGLSPADVSQLFRPFQQTSVGLRSGQGSGLGLSISREFAQLLGGTVTVESILGEGTTFTVTIAAHQTQPSTASVSADQTGAITGLAPGQPAYRILVADDHDDSRSL